MSDNLFNLDKPKLEISASGLHIVDSEIAEQIEKKNISPSLITAFEGCAARWLGSTYVVNDLIVEEDNAATRGSLFHRVMEHFFYLPPEERTKQNLSVIVQKTLSESDFKHFKTNPDAKQWLNNALKNYYAMKAKPEKVKIATINDQWGNEKQGLEVFIKGNIGNASKEVLGFIDCLLVDPRDSSKVVIQDWKTGGKVKEWKHHTKDNEGLGEARQQVIYAMLLKNHYNLDVSAARLIYPVAKTKSGENDSRVVYIDLDNKKFNDNVVKSVESTEQKMNVMLENNTFEYSPDFLCAWCPLAKICPAATIKPYAKMQTAYASQPEPELLETAIETK